MKKFWLAWGLGIIEILALVYILLSTTKYPWIGLWDSLSATILHAGYYGLLVAVLLIECLVYRVACIEHSRVGSSPVALLMVYNTQVLNFRPDCAMVTWVLYGLLAVVWLAKGLSVYLRDREWDFPLTCLRKFLMETMLTFGAYYIYQAQVQLTDVARFF